MHGLHILQLPLHPHLPKKPKEDIDFHFFNSNANYHVMSYLFLIYLYVHHFVIKVEDIFKPYVNLLQNFYRLYLSVSTCFFLCNCTQTSVFGILLLTQSGTRHSISFVVSHMYDLVSVSTFILAAM